MNQLAWAREKCPFWPGGWNVEGKPVKDVRQPCGMPLLIEHISDHLSTGPLTWGTEKALYLVGLQLVQNLLQAEEPVA